jgi:23S rRNA (uridine2552-2'-O)-methyltransferase
VIAVDPRRIEPMEGVEVVHARVGDAGLLERVGRSSFQVVLSDMSPAISGAYSTDHARSVELVRAGFSLARRALTPGGAFVAKVFAGDLLPELEAELAPHFERIRRSKPPASREPSSELYVLALKFRREGEPSR